MEKPKFVNLHLRSHYSFLPYGKLKIPDIVNRCILNGMHAAALADLGNMYGIKEFHDYAANCDKRFTPILGIELACENHRILLLAKNKAGYRNLCRLASLVRTGDFYGPPAVSKALLARCHKGVICASSGTLGEIPQLLLAGMGVEAEAEISWFKSLFADDYYIELQRNPPKADDEPDDIDEYLKSAEPLILDLARRTSTKVICTPNSPGFTTPDEMVALWPDLPEGLANTLEVADKVKKFSLNAPLALPKLKFPDGIATADDYLTHLTYAGAHRLYGTHLTAEQESSISEELKLIKSKGLSSYFLTISDIVCGAREEVEIWARADVGNAVTSVVAYCLGISDVDPLKFGLLSAHLIDDSPVLPDIKLEVEDTGRDRLIGWMVNRYGADAVARAAQFILVPSNSGCADEYKGTVCSVCAHYSDIVIARGALRNFVPTTVLNKDELVSQYDERHLDGLGPLRLSIWGNTGLSVMKETVRLVKAHTGEDIDVNNIPTDDPEVFKLIAEGGLSGLVNTMTENSIRRDGIKPASFDDLIEYFAQGCAEPMYEERGFAVCCAWRICQMAWLKVHHKAEFVAALQINDYKREL